MSERLAPARDLAALARRADPDRFLCALFAPPAARDLLFLIACFHHELARARAAVREPGLALIRLQWWREVVEGAARRHEVATPLSAALDSGRLDRATLLAMVDGREAEADEIIPTFQAWHDYLHATHGNAALAAGKVLGVTEPSWAALRGLGAAYGAGIVLRTHRALARQGRCLLPDVVLGRHDMSVFAVLSKPDNSRLRPVLQELAEAARGWIRPVVAPVAARLQGVLAKRDLRRPGVDLGPRGAADRLAVTLAGMMGR
jgi:phytoene synthase